MNKRLGWNWQLGRQCRLGSAVCHAGKAFLSTPGTGASGRTLLSRTPTDGASYLAVAGRSLWCRAGGHRESSYPVTAWAWAVRRAPYNFNFFWKYPAESDQRRTGWGVCSGFSMVVVFSHPVLAELRNRGKCNLGLDSQWTKLPQ